MKNEINIACNWNSIGNSTEIFLFSPISNRNPFFLLEWFSCLYCSSRSHYTDEQSETHDKCWKINHKFDKLNKKNWTVHKLNPNKKKEATFQLYRHLGTFIYSTVRYEYCACSLLKLCWGGKGHGEDMSFSANRCHVCWFEKRWVPL